MPAGYYIDNQDIKNLAKVLRKVDPELAKRMRRNIRTAIKPVVQDMRNQLGENSMNAWVTRPKANYRAYDGPRGPGGITNRMQRAVRIQISAGRVRVYVSSAALGSAMRLPAYLDAGVSWRHPVMGNRKAWVAQRGTAAGWFNQTAEAAWRPLTATVRDALDQTARELAAKL